MDYIVDNSLSDIVLLGHSFGGTIISKVAETVPERIRRLVFLNAFVLQMPTLSGDTVKIRAAYQDFFALWKDADPDVPILKQAREEYSRLK